jgi:hypothetical protein
MDVAKGCKLATAARFFTRPAVDCRDFQLDEGISLDQLTNGDCSSRSVQGSHPLVVVQNCSNTTSNSLS